MKPPNPAKPETRIVAIGDSDFATNGDLGIPGNRDLFLNIVNWLAQQENLISIRPRDPQERRDHPHGGQDRCIFWLTVLIIPGLILLGRRPDLVAEAVDARSAFLRWTCSSSLIALGGYLYFVESKKPAGGDAEKKDKVFTRRRRTRSTSSRSSRSQASARRCGRAASDWQIVQPRRRQAGPGEVSGITSNLASLEIQRVIDENPSDLKEYGLTQPRVEVAFKAGGKDHKLLIGQKTPPGSDLYARLADQKRVVLIPSFLDTTFNKTTFDLRDKSVLKVDRDEIGCAGGHDAGEHDAVREVERRVEADAAGRGARRLQRGRRARQPA